MTGNWPRSDVDHKDMDGLNNRWSNLREATRGENNANTRVRSDNRLGVKGVALDKRNGSYRAYISYGRKKRHLGAFATIAEASAAYAEAARAAYGEFARSE